MSNSDVPYYTNPFAWSPGPSDPEHRVYADLWREWQKGNIGDTYFIMRADLIGRGDIARNLVTADKL